MAELQLVADGADPQPDYGFLPRNIGVWAGYLGGHTPHAWTWDEVAALERTGRVWWGIWTAPDRQVIDAGQGATDAADTIGALRALRRPTTDPVFYDVEYATWHADPAGAQAAADRWKADVAAAGWRHAYWYGPLASRADWVADWTGARPGVLPAGRVGVQYDHALSGDRYDISVFHPAVAGPTGGDPNTMDLTNPLDKTLLEQVAAMHDWMHALDYGMRGGPAGEFTERGEVLTRVRATHGQVVAMAAKVGALAAGPATDVTTLAELLATNLGPALGKSLVDALAARLQA